MHPADLHGEIHKLSWEQSLRDTQTRTFEAIRGQHQATRYQNTIGQHLTPQLAPGDLVMVKNRNTAKLEDKAQGPYQVVRVNRGGTVHITHPETGKFQRLPPDLVFRYQPKTGKNEIIGYEGPTSSDEEATLEATRFLYEPKPSTAKVTSSREKRPERLRKLPVPDYSKFF